MTGLSVADARRTAYVGSLSRKSGHEASDNWHTPAEWIERFREVLGGIELDPFSSEAANGTVRALRFFTKERPAAQQDWTANTVFMNPPYSLHICFPAISRLVDEFKRGRVGAAIVLVNNMTDTKWFRLLEDAADLSCNITGRISFLTKDNKRISGNTRGQTIFLLANKTSPARSRFKAIMRNYGRVRVGV